MSQSLRQRLGLRAAMQLFGATRSRTPWTRRNSGQSIIRRFQRREALRRARARIADATRAALRQLDTWLRRLGTHIAVGAGSVALTLALAVQPVIDAKDAEIARLDALVHHHAQARQQQQATLTLAGPADDIEDYAKAIANRRAGRKGANP
jgi:hypothetical protein